MDFMQLYRQYAPLGAKLKRIEREIEIHEKEYLEILHHLGLARLKQQNAEMMSNMKVLDIPTLPINPEPSKKKIFIIVVSFFSAIFYVFGLFIFELLDKRVKNPTKLARFTKIKKQLGPFAGKTKKDGYNTNELSIHSAKHIIENIILKKPSHLSEKPVIIQLMSHWDNEGKSFISKKIVRQFEASGVKMFRDKHF